MRLLQLALDFVQPSEIRHHHDDAANLFVLFDDGRGEVPGKRGVVFLPKVEFSLEIPPEYDAYY